MKHLLPWISILLPYFVFAQKPVLVVPLGHTDAVTCLDYSEDGQYMVSGSNDLTVKIWNQDGRLLRTFPSHQSGLLDVHFSPNTKYVVSRTADRLYLWEFNGKLIWESSVISPPERGAVTSYGVPSFSPDGESLLFGLNNQKGMVYNIQTGKSFEIDCDWPANLHFSPDGKSILSSRGNQVLLHNLQGKITRQFTVANPLEQYFPRFNALFKGNDQILIAFTYVMDEGFLEKSEYHQSGGFARIYTLDGQVLKVIGKEPRKIGADAYGFEEVNPQTGQPESKTYPLTFRPAFEYHSVTGNIDLGTMKWIDLITDQKGEQMVLSYREMTSLWELETGKQKLFPAPEKVDPGSVAPYPTAFSPDGNYLALVRGDSLAVYHKEQDQLQFLPVHKGVSGNFMTGSWPIAVAFSPVEGHLTVGYFNGRIAVWDVTGNLIREIGKTSVHEIIEVTSDPENQSCYSFYYLQDDYQFGQTRWEIQKDTFRFSFEWESGVLTDFAPAKGNEIILDPKYFPAPNGLTYEDQLSGYLISSPKLPGITGKYETLYMNTLEGYVSVSKNRNSKDDYNFYVGNTVWDLGLAQQRHLLVAKTEGAPLLYDFSKIHKLASSSSNLEKDDYGATLLKKELLPSIQPQTIAELPAKTEFLDFLNNQPLLLYKPGDYWEYVEEAGKARYIPRYLTDFHLFNLDTRKTTTTFTGHPLKVIGARFVKQGRYALSWSADHTCKLWDTQNGKELATIYWINQADWVAVAPNGLFDASPGAMNELYYVVDREIIELEQLKTRYYEPNLLIKLLGYSTERIRPIDQLGDLKLYPEVEEMKVEGQTLQVRLKARSGGIGRAVLFINNKEVVPDANPPGATSGSTRSSSFQVDLKPFQRLLKSSPDAVNIISLRVYNEEGWLKSPAINLEYHPEPAKARGVLNVQTTRNWVGELRPKMYVVSIGTSDYTGDQLDLQYPDQDAAKMARALQAIGSALFTNGDSLEVYCFTTAATDKTSLENQAVKWSFSTKAGIEKTFQDIRNKAKAEDVVVVYLSGHGVTYGSSDGAQFHYLTQGISTDDLSDVAIRQAYTISSEELTQWINAIPALKQVLIIDACNSGQVVESLIGGTKQLSSSQIRALDRMKDRTGMFILSGSAADKVSYEASEYGQGLLTYALLQGMLGVAINRTAEGDYIDVMKLFQHARDEVPRLASTINGIQTPMLGFPAMGASFDIGILNDQAKSNIVLSNKKPVIIRSNFLNEVTFDDDIGLVEKLEQAFREETEEGADADFIYVDVNKYTGAWALRGLYRLENGTINVKIKLFKDGVAQKDLTVRPSDDPERLARYIVREVKNALEE